MNARLKTLQSESHSDGRAKRRSLSRCFVVGLGLLLISGGNTVEGVTDDGISFRSAVLHPDMSRNRVIEELRPAGYELTQVGTEDKGERTYIINPRRKETIHAGRIVFVGQRAKIITKYWQGTTGATSDTLIESMFAITGFDTHQATITCIDSADGLPIGQRPHRILPRINAGSRNDEVYAFVIDFGSRKITLYVNGPIEETVGIV